MNSSKASTTGAAVTTMRAAIVDRYGPPSVVHIDAVERPKLKPGHLIVRIRSAGVSSGDARLRGGRFPDGFGFVSRPVIGFTGPRARILGGVYAGTVEAVGPATEAGFAVGDRVCGMTGMRMGCHAEFVAVPATKAVRIPDGVSDDDAAALLFGGSTAMHYLRTLTQVEPGMTVLVIGASGAVGTNLLQLAAHLGATVTGMTSAGNAELVERLGATDTIDYATTSLADLTASGRRFDIVVDTVGHVTPAVGKALLTDRGVLLLVVANLWNTITAHGNVKGGPASEKTEHLEYVMELLRQGALTPVIDRTVDFDGLVGAYGRIDSGRKIGNIVLHPWG